MPNGSNRAHLQSSLSAYFGGTRHVSSLLDHYEVMTQKVIAGDSEKTILRAGKFVEAATKIFGTFTNYNFPSSMRRYSVGAVIIHLKQLPVGIAVDSVRVTVPRVLEFVFDVASNRGARHDPHEIDSNDMDAGVVMSCCTWVLSEMLRVADAGTSTPDQTMEIVQGLIHKVTPLFETIDDRDYVNVIGISGPKYALLLLFGRYPERVSKAKLLADMKRVGYKKSTSSMSIRRVMSFADYGDDDTLRLRANGLTEAQRILEGL